MHQSSTSAPSIARRRGIRSSKSSGIVGKCLTLRGTFSCAVSIAIALLLALTIIIFGVYSSSDAVAAAVPVLNANIKVDVNEDKIRRHLRKPAGLAGIERVDMNDPLIHEENEIGLAQIEAMQKFEKRHPDFQHLKIKMEENLPQNPLMHFVPKRRKRERSHDNVDMNHHHVHEENEFDTAQKELMQEIEKVHPDFRSPGMKMKENHLKQLASEIQELQMNLHPHQVNEIVGLPEHRAPDFQIEDHQMKSFKFFVPQGGRRYEEYKSGTKPRAITQQMRDESDETARKRREYVKDAMIHAWSGYKKYAFGADELLPISKRAGVYWGGLGVTLVDSLDTLWLMGMREEFWEARDWVRDKLSFDNVGAVSVFETTIRSLGGLLSAYDWSGDPVFLEKADDLGSRLLDAFNSPNGFPYEQTKLNEHYSFNADWQRNFVKISEIGTLQLEFRYLAHATGKSIYAEKVNHVFDLLADNQPSDGLYPIYVEHGNSDVRFKESKSTLGGSGDSLYEYMLKTWIQGGKIEKQYRTMFDKAMDGAHKKLVQKSVPDGLTYVADLEGDRLDHKMDHLACFMGGLWALGAYTNPDGLDSPKAQRDLEHGKAITYTCYQMYARSVTGLAPEIARFDGNPEGQDISTQVSTYLLRPETVESLFILNYLTGDPIYREWGWEIFQAIERFCRTDEGYGQINDVGDVNAQPQDKMESFFLAETLKYLYLLFDPDTEVDILKTHVFNTEAHPLRMLDLLD